MARACSVCSLDIISREGVEEAIMLNQPLRTIAAQHGVKTHNSISYHRDNCQFVSELVPGVKAAIEKSVAEKAQNLVVDVEKHIRTLDLMSDSMSAVAQVESRPVPHRIAAANVAGKLALGVISALGEAQHRQQLMDRIDKIAAIKAPSPSQVIEHETAWELDQTIQQIAAE